MMTRSAASWLIPSLTLNPSSRNGHVCKVCNTPKAENRCACCGYHYHAKYCCLDSSTLQLAIGQSLVCTTCLNLGLNNATVRSEDPGLATDQRQWVPSPDTQSTWMLLTQQQDEPPVLTYYSSGERRQVNALIPFIKPGLTEVRRKHHRYCQVCTKQTRCDTDVDNNFVPDPTSFRTCHNCGSTVHQACLAGGGGKAIGKFHCGFCTNRILMTAMAVGKAPPANKVIKESCPLRGASFGSDFLDDIQVVACLLSKEAIQCAGFDLRTVMEQIREKPQHALKLLEVWDKEVSLDNVMPEFGVASLASLTSPAQPGVALSASGTMVSQCAGGAE